MAVTLVTGPVRSGKSRYVTQMAASSGLPVTYVATAARDPEDSEWNERLRRHVEDRPANWQTVETASLTHRQLLEIFTGADGARCIVVDALGTWLAARLSQSLEAFERNYVAFESQLDREAQEFANAMLDSNADVFVVAEEAGWDVVPVMPSGRLFRDVLGRMKQLLASRARSVYLVASGFALDLRALGTRIE